MLIPVPTHRNFDEICIEHFYLDEELLTENKEGRRFFFGTEFEKDGRHTSGKFKYSYPKKLTNRYVQILDSGVVNQDGKSVALSKMDFANLIVNNVQGFDRFTFFHYKDIFKSIKEIIEDSKTEYSR